MSDSATVRRVTPDELDAVVAEVIDSKTESFALLGPRLDAAWFRESLPEVLRHRALFQLTSPTTCIPQRLASMTRLRELILCDLNLGGSDAAALARSHEHVRSLHLGMNQVGDDGAWAAEPSRSGIFEASSASWGISGPSTTATKS